MWSKNMLSDVFMAISITSGHSRKYINRSVGDLDTLLFMVSTPVDSVIFDIDQCCSSYSLNHGPSADLCLVY